MKQRAKTYDGFLTGTFAYEARPYFALFVGAVGIYDARMHGSLTCLLSGIVLLASGALLLHWRKEHRRK